MSDAVVQWIEEIQGLKQHLAELQKERDAAHEKEANWRKLYSTEAKQRRTEARLAQEEIERLQAEIAQLQTKGRGGNLNSLEAGAKVEQEIAGLETREKLKQKLAEVIQERDRLAEALKTEQEKHAQTRKSLTGVIGETIDQLAKVKGSKNEGLQMKEQV
ncbi:MAG: hypothetical protein F6K10_13700 [Moorea sp. SIO2B7]|nr:hypothetical protein [Moorena sp. SIO2B7]